MRVPMIQEIRLNGQNICSDKRQGQFTSVHHIVTSTDNSNNKRERDSVTLSNNDEEPYRNSYNTRAPEIDLSTRYSPNRKDDVVLSTRDRTHSSTQRTTTRPHQNNRSTSNANTYTSNNHNSDTNLYQSTRRTTITRQTEPPYTRGTPTTTTEGIRHVRITSQPSYFQGDLNYNQNKNKNNFDINSNSRTERVLFQFDLIFSRYYNLYILLESYRR